MTPANHILLRSLLTKEGWAQHSPSLIEEALSGDTNLRTLYHQLPDMHEVAAGDLRLVDLEASLAGHPREEELAELCGRITDIEAPTPDIVFAAIQRSLRASLAMEAARDIVARSTDPDFDPAKAYEYLERAVKLEVDSTPPVVSLEETGLPDVKNDRPNMCSLAISPRLDRACRGGIAAGEMLVFLGGPKRGKTAILSAIGANAALQGKNVLHVTLEISSKLAARRYDAALTGLDYDQMVAQPSLVQRARAPLGNRVMFVDWQYEDHSPADIQPILNYCEKLGTPIDLLIVDYLQLMVPNGTRSLRRMEQRHLYSLLGKDMRGLAKHNNIPVITAWQLNREGAGEDVPDERHIAESWDIPAHVDLLIVLSSTTIEKGKGQLTARIALSRFNAQHTAVKFDVDFGRTKFTEAVR